MLFFFFLHHLDQVIFLYCIKYSRCVAMKNLPVALCLCMVIALEFYHHQNCRQVKLLGG